MENNNVAGQFWQVCFKPDSYIMLTPPMINFPYFYEVFNAVLKWMRLIKPITFLLSIFHPECKWVGQLINSDIQIPIPFEDLRSHGSVCHHKFRNAKRHYWDETLDEK